MHGSTESYESVDAYPTSVTCRPEAVAAISALSKDGSSKRASRTLLQTRLCEFLVWPVIVEPDTGHVLTIPCACQP